MRKLFVTDAIEFPCIKPRACLLDFWYWARVDPVWIVTDCTQNSLMYRYLYMCQMNQIYMHITHIWCSVAKPLNIQFKSSSRQRQQPEQQQQWQHQRQQQRNQKQKQQKQQQRQQLEKRKTATKPTVKQQRQQQQRKQQHQHDNNRDNNNDINNIDINNKINTLLTTIRRRNTKYQTHGVGNDRWINIRLKLQ